MGLAPVAVSDLAASLNEGVGELRDAHPDRIIHTRFVIDQPVVCDRGRLQQLVSNLVGNEIHHGAPDRPVEASARIDNGWLEIMVLNDGEPIAAANLAHMFEPYWRPVTSSPGGGLGLGLYICSQIAKAHGGEMQVSSDAAQGTRFVARVPLQPASPVLRIG